MKEPEHGLTRLPAHRYFTILEFEFDRAVLFGLAIGLVGMAVVLSSCGPQRGSSPRGDESATSVGGSTDAIVIDAQGNTTLESATVVGKLTAGSALVTGTLSAGDTATLDSATIAKDLVVTGKTISSSAEIQNGLTVTGKLTLGEELILNKKTTLTETQISDLTVTEPTFFRVMKGAKNRAGGDVYKATPQDCITTCAENGGRMATISEAYAVAAAGYDICAVMWLLAEPVVPVSTRANSGGEVIAAYPMYTNQSTYDCNSKGTGNVPRVEFASRTVDWCSKRTFDCGCMSLGGASDNVKTKPPSAYCPPT